MIMATRIIISLGGSILIPKTGFDPVFLKAFRAFILAEIKKGRTFLFIVGGGATCRMYQQALRTCTSIMDDDLDWMGIAATKINAEFVRLLFKDSAYKEVVANPTKKIRTTKPIIVASGYMPGNSSDFGAVTFAKTVGATDVINLSNIAYAYDKDPAIYNDARKIKKISWKDFRKIVGNTWEPGLNLPFDPVASREAEKLGLRVSILCGTDLTEVKKAISGRTFRGTRIF